MRRLLHIRDYEYGKHERNGQEESYVLISGVTKYGQIVNAFASGKKADTLDKAVDDRTPPEQEPRDSGIVLDLNGYISEPRNDQPGAKYLIIRSFDVVSGPALELMHIRADAADALERATNASDVQDSYEILRTQIARIADETPSTTLQSKSDLQESAATGDRPTPEITSEDKSTAPDKGGKQAGEQKAGHGKPDLSQEPYGPVKENEIILDDDPRQKAEATANGSPLHQGREHSQTTREDKKGGLKNGAQKPETTPSPDDETGLNSLFTM